jgi:L-ascorbate metabolism protein UlaG (beta-lactamase superfamily)
MGLILKGPDAVIYLDPCLSDTIADRLFPPPVLPEQCTDVDYVLCSHEHIDHLDQATLRPLAVAAPQARFVSNRWCVPLLQECGIDSHRIIAPNTLETIALPDCSLQVTLTPSAHLAREIDPDKGDRWTGFLLQWNGVTVYFAGDTIHYDGYEQMLRDLPPADLAVLPINGRDWYRTQSGLLGNFHPDEAAILARELGWDLVIAGHNDLLARNAIPMGWIADGFERHAPRQAWITLPPGQLLTYTKRDSR